MSKNAIVFPGQASQNVGMGENLYENSNQAKDIYDRAESYFDEFSITEVSFKGPLQKLTQTKVTQPAIFTNSYALFNEIEEDCNIQGMAGHSLGEYTALVASGAISFEQGLEIVKIRAREMQKAAEQTSGSMAAIIGLKLEDIKAGLKDIGNFGICEIANHNSNKQIVISGETPAVQKAMRKLKDAGARRAIELSVGGAFHSPLMEGARDILEETLNEADISQPDYPIYCNYTGTPTKDPEELRNNLKKQLTSPVLWVDTINNMIKDNFDNYIEVGPGKVLQGLIRRISRDVDIDGISKYKDLENFKCK